MEFTAPVEAISLLESDFAVVQKLLGEEIWRAGDSDLVECLRRVHRLVGQVQGLQAGLVAEVEQRGIPAAVGAVEVRSWLRSVLTMSPGEAKTTAKMAEALVEKRKDTEVALAAGRVSWEQARAIVEVVGRLARTATIEQQGQVETFLLERADQLTAADMRRLEKVLAHYLDPDGLEPAEEKAKAKRGAHLMRNGDGTQTLRWTDTHENIALLQAALEPLAGPKPGPDGERDPRDPALRRADALVDLVSMTLRHGDLPSSRGVRPHLVITLGDAPLAATASGEHLSDAAVRRICCDAELTAIRLDAHGVPLSMGRTRRIVSPAQWLALVARDSGCVFTGCDRPAPWCQAHSGSTGSPEALRTSRISCCCATGTTTSCITSPGMPNSGRMATPNYGPRRGSTPNENPDAISTGRPGPRCACAEPRPTTCKDRGP
jgi:hypothetical protein